jgi:hypothetical protein
MLPRVLALSVLVACASTRSADPAEEEPFFIFGQEGLPADPPDVCKRLGKVEATRLDKQEPPIGDLVDEVKKQGGNALAHVRKGGFKDNYLGKEYEFRGVAFLCPAKKPSPSATSSASGPGSAKP